MEPQGTPNTPMSACEDRLDALSNQIIGRGLTVMRTLGTGFLLEIKRILAASDTPEAARHSLSLGPSSLAASLSGSGSALYGLYRTRGDAEAAQERLKLSGVRSTLTRTLPRAAYWREMLLKEED